MPPAKASSRNMLFLMTLQIHKATAMASPKAEDRKLIFARLMSQGPKLEYAKGVVGGYVRKVNYTVSGDDVPQ
jgi:hypothetical protein